MHERIKIHSTTCCRCVQERIERHRKDVAFGVTYMKSNASSLANYEAPLG